MGLTRRKKKRTQDPSQLDAAAAAAAERGEKVPKSLVFGRGKLPPLLRQLQADIRRLMLPHTALHLKEKKRNTLKDFVHVAGPLGVTHFLILSNTDIATYLRVARCPHGPTLTFKLNSYSLVADVAKAQLHPGAPANIFKCAPLIVLAGFGSEEEQLKLTTKMFQNIFPAIDVNTVKLSTCQRVVLLNYDKQTRNIELRHYAISLQPVGVSRRLRKLVQHRKIPDLRGLGDVSEFVTKPGYGSESEAEDDSATVHLASDYGRVNHAAQQSAVKLHELGPRLTLQLVKVEEGLCDGAVMFHEYVKKSPEEQRLLQENKEKADALRRQRRAEQEANVHRKELAKQALRKQSMKAKWQRNEEIEEEPEDQLDDADWYRQEVGQEPDAEFLAGSSRKGTGRSKKHALKAKRFDQKSDRNTHREGATPRKRKREEKDEHDIRKKGKKGHEKPAFSKKRFGTGIAEKIILQRKQARLHTKQKRK